VQRIIDAAIEGQFSMDPETSQQEHINTDPT